MFKADDFTTDKYEISITPVYHVVKFSKAESDRVSLEKSFDMVHDNYGHFWVCRKLKYHDIEVSFETLDNTVCEKLQTQEELSATINFENEEVCIDNFRLVDLQVCIICNVMKFSGRLRGYLNAHS